MKLAGGGILLKPTEVPLPTEVAEVEVVETVEAVATGGATFDFLADIQWGTVVYWAGMFLLFLLALTLVRALIRRWRKR